MDKAFGERRFYVGATRSSHELRIYTNDKDMVARAVGVKQDKASVIEVINKEANKADRMQGRAYKER